MFIIRRCWLSRELRHTVNEADVLNQFTESLYCADPVPALLGFECELQHHGERQTA